MDHTLGTIAKASDGGTHGAVLPPPRTSGSGHLSTTMTELGRNNGNELDLAGTNATETIAGTVDTPSVNSGDASSALLVTLPYGGGTCTMCRGMGTCRFLTLTTMLAHMAERHPGSKAVLECSKCGRRYESDRSRGALIHLGKCKGPVEGEPSEGAFKCCSCPRSFKTKSGLSQHENTCAPEVRNTKRLEGITRKPRKPSNRVSKFTNEILTIMLQTELNWTGGIMINKALEATTGLTCKQIASKRREATYRRKLELLRAEVLGEAQAQTEGSEADQADQGSVLLEEAQPEETLQADLTVEDTEPSEQSREEETAWKTDLLETVRLLDAGKHGKDASEIVRLLKQAANLEPSQERLNTLLEAMHSYCGAKDKQAEKEAGAPAASHQKGRQGKKSYKKGKAKRTRFAEAQNLFKADKRALAKHALTGTPLGERVKVAAPREQVEELYRKLWSVKSPCRVEPLREPAERIPLHRFTVITAGEVKTRLQRMAANTAPGRDGLKKSALMGDSKAVILAAFYNLVLAWGLWPSEWRTNRTSLLPKEGKDPTLATNYRPLTISSTMNRVFMGILDGRIRSLITIHPRQKGFVAEPGCYQNIQILDQAIRVMKKEGGVGIQLDISKAFDTVPHEAIKPILRGKGVPCQIIQLILESYRETKTSIAMEGGDIMVEIVRGVKQGDPMSPLLFILIIEPLLERLESMEGLKLSGEKVCSLAFADDLYLLAKDAASAQALMDETARSLRDLGMSLSASKSFAFEYRKAPGKSFVRVDPGIKILGEAVPEAGPQDTLTYLGVTVSPWRDGVTLKGFEGRVEQALGRLNALALKPEQKLLILKENLMAHWQYQLTAEGPTRAFLKRVDCIIRKFVKELLRLPRSVTNWLLYARCADGGLGLQLYEDTIPRYILSQGHRMRTSKDALCRAVSESVHYTKRLQNAAKEVRLVWPCSDKEITKAKRRQQKGYLKAWSELKTQGKAVHSFKGDGIGNCWLRDPSLLKSSRLITALQMRANVCADKVSLSRVRRNADVKCRKATCGLPETLGHILGQCLENKSERMDRHDEIKNFIAQRMLETRGTEVMTEERLKLQNGEVRQPDLIVKNQKGVFVVDVTVRLENGSYLQDAAKSKLERYQPTLPQIRQIFSAQKAQVVPIVVGARGALPKMTQKGLAMLGIKSRSDLQTIALMALRASIEIYHRFLDYDKRPYLRTGQPDTGEADEE